MTGEYVYSAEECWASHPSACRACNEPRPWAPGDPRFLMWVTCNHYLGPGEPCTCTCHEGELCVA